MTASDFPEPEAGTRPRLRTLRLGWDGVAIAGALLFGNTLLDWVSFIHPVGHLNITPWNPNVGFSFAMVLLFGRKFLPCFVVAPFVADLILRGGDLPILVELASTLAYVTSYSVILYVLAPPILQFDLTLPTVREISILCGLTCLGAAFSSFALVAVLATSGHLESPLEVTAFVRGWIGDAIGIVVMTPLVLIVGTGRLPRLNLVGDAFKFLAVVGAVSLVFSVPDSAQFQLFYLVFLPIVWIAFTYGLPTTTVALALTQAVVVLWMQSTLRDDAAVVTFQIMLYVLSVTGLLAGAAVSQYRRADELLLQQREAAGRVSRLMSVGALGAAIAHEINQPLSAIGTYADIVESELRSAGSITPLASEAASKISIQVKRAATIVRNMREVVTLARTDATPINLGEVLNTLLSSLRSEADQHDINIVLDAAPKLPRVLIEKIQFEQLIENLVRNAIEAIDASGLPNGSITVSAVPFRPGEIRMSVADTGPGFPGDIAVDHVMPLKSTKPHGMGLGLLICRTIVEQHGGNLWIDNSPSGATVCATLRAES